MVESQLGYLIINWPTTPKRLSIYIIVKLCLERSAGWLLLRYPCVL